jgi:hypothetical protein
MLNSPLFPLGDAEPGEDEFERVVEAGPLGAIALAGVATFVVVAIWLAFYLFVFTPRGATP